MKINGLIQNRINNFLMNQAQKFVTFAATTLVYLCRRDGATTVKPSDRAGLRAKTVLCTLYSVKTVKPWETRQTVKNLA